MSWRTTIGLLTATAVTALGLAACSDPNPAPADSRVVQVTGDSDSVFADTDDEDTPDCDAEDRAKNETPDCGFSYRGRFYAWSWVKAGKKTPPPGWRSLPEQAAVVRAPATTGSKKVTTSSKPATGKVKQNRTK
jgi:hypothetical protein